MRKIVDIKMLSSRDRSRFERCSNAAKEQNGLGKSGEKSTNLSTLQHRTLFLNIMLHSSPGHRGDYRLKCHEIVNVLIDEKLDNVNETDPQKWIHGSKNADLAIVYNAIKEILFRTAPIK